MYAAHMTRGLRAGERKVNECEQQATMPEDRLEHMSEVRIDEEVVLWAVNGASATKAQALLALKKQPLLLLMHGFGSFEGDLIGLASQLPQAYVLASPRAPLVAPPPIVNGFAWWPLPLSPQGMPIKQPDPSEFAGSGPHLAAVALLEWLDALDSQVRSVGAGASSGPDDVSNTGTALGTDPGIGLGQIALMGFSQGGCMVTSLLRLRPERFAGGVNCSGFVAPGTFDGDARLAELQPPLFWGRDEADPIIDEHRISLTAKWAPTHTALDARLYSGILHGIGADELADIRVFLQQHVPEVSSAQR